MVFAIEYFLQSSNGTGRKEKGHQQILASLKKQHSLFADILKLPVIDSVRVDWSDGKLSLFSNSEKIVLDNTASSLFARMRVGVEQNRCAAMPVLEPLTFISPTKAYHFTSNGLDGLQKREMRSTDRRVLVRWFWIDDTIKDDSCEVIVQFAVPKEELRLKRKREDDNVDSTMYLQRMTKILENMYAAQQAHHARMEQLMASLCNQPHQSPGPNISPSQNFCNGGLPQDMSGMADYFCKNPFDPSYPFSDRNH